MAHGAIRKDMKTQQKKALPKLEGFAGQNGKSFRFAGISFNSVPFAEAANIPPFVLAEGGAGALIAA